MIQEYYVPHQGEREICPLGQVERSPGSHPSTKGSTHPRHQPSHSAQAVKEIEEALARYREEQRLEEDDGDELDKEEDDDDEDDGPPPLS